MLEGGGCHWPKDFSTMGVQLLLDLRTSCDLGGQACSRECFMNCKLPPNSSSALLNYQPQRGSLPSNALAKVVSLVVFSLSPSFMIQ